MRVVEIALFLFIFNISIGLVNSMIVTFPELGILSSVTKDMPETSYAESTAGEVTAAGAAVAGTATDVVGQVFNWFNIVWRGFIILIPTVISFISNIVFGISTFITILIPLPEIYILAWTLQVIVWAIYAIGFMQWISGRGFKEYT